MNLKELRESKGLTAEQVVDKVRAFSGYEKFTVKRYNAIESKAKEPKVAELVVILYKAIPTTDEERTQIYNYFTD